VGDRKREVGSDMKVVEASGGSLRSLSRSSSFTSASLGNVKDGIVVVWPYAVVLTAIGCMVYGEVVWFMVKHVTASPTESAAAALFAVVVGFHSALSYGSGPQALGGGAKATGSARDGAFNAATTFTSAADAYAYYGAHFSVDNVMDQMRCTNDYLNQQYAVSVQYLKDTADFLQSQSVAQSQQAVLDKLNVLSQYYCCSSQSQGQGVPLGSERKAAAAGSGRLIEGREKVGAVVRHKRLHDDFVWCMGTAADSEGLPTREAIQSLFKRRDDPAAAAAAAAAGAGSPGCDARDWRSVLRKRTETMDYSAWSMPLRRGFNVYRTRTVFRGATSRDFIRFMTDDGFRQKWDKNSSVWEVCDREQREDLLRLGSHGGAGKAKRDAMSLGNLYCKVRIPPPFAARQYFLRRSVWTDSATGDGEIICSSRAPSEVPVTLDRGSGNVTIHDYLSCCSARTLPSEDGSGDSRVEVTFMYFEDTRLPAALVNQIIKRRMENTLEEMEKAMRSHMALVKEAKSLQELTLSALAMGRKGPGFSGPAGEDFGALRGEGGEEKKKGLVGRMASVVTVACLMPFSTRWILPVILSEITRQSSAASAAR